MDTTKSVLIDAVRSELAFPSTLVMPRSQWSDIIDRFVVNELSNNLPMITFDKITTVAGTQSYTITDPEDIVEISEVYHYDAASNSNIYNQCLELDTLFDIDLFSEPAITYINDLQLSYLKKHNTYEGKYLNGTLKLTPPPTSAYDVYYKVYKRWTYATLPQSFYDILFKFLLYKGNVIIKQHLTKMSYMYRENFNTLIKNVTSEIKRTREDWKDAENNLARQRLTL